MKSFILSAGALLLATATADLTCQPFIYGNSATNQGYIAYPDFNNITIGNKQAKNFHISQNMAKISPAGYTFNIRSCTSNTLELVEPCVEPSQVGDVTYSTYFNTIQIVDPRSGKCLTRPMNSDGAVNFQNCNQNPTTYAQLWLGSQTSYPGFIFPVAINPIEFRAWQVANTKFQTMLMDSNANADRAPQFSTLRATGQIPYSLNVGQCTATGTNSRVAAAAAAGSA